MCVNMSLQLRDSRLPKSITHTTNGNVFVFIYILDSCVQDNFHTSRETETDACCRVFLQFKCASRKKGYVNDHVHSVSLTLYIYHISPTIVYMSQVE